MTSRKYITTAAVLFMCGAAQGQSIKVSLLQEQYPHQPYQTGVNDPYLGGEHPRYWQMNTDGSVVHLSGTQLTFDLGPGYQTASMWVGVDTDGTNTSGPEGIDFYGFVSIFVDPQNIAIPPIPSPTVADWVSVYVQWPPGTFTVGYVRWAQGGGSNYGWLSKDAYGTFEALLQGTVTDPNPFELFEDDEPGAHLRAWISGDWPGWIGHIDHLGGSSGGLTEGSYSEVPIVFDPGDPDEFEEPDWTADPEAVVFTFDLATLDLDSNPLINLAPLSQEVTIDLSWYMTSIIKQLVDAFVLGSASLAAGFIVFNELRKQ